MEQQQNTYQRKETSYIQIKIWVYVEAQPIWYFFSFSLHLKQKTESSKIESNESIMQCADHWSHGNPNCHENTAKHSELMQQNVKYAYTWQQILHSG